MNRVLVFVVALILTIAIFLIESWTPHSFAHGLLYLLPLVLIRHEFIALQSAAAVMITGMIVMGYFGSPPGNADDYVVLNRGLSVLAIWAIVVIQADGRAKWLASSPPGRAPSSRVREERV